MLSSRTYHDWLQIARERWLSPDELSVILHNHQRLGFPTNFHKPLNPHDGALYIYDRNVVPDFKLDGVDWAKKKDSNKVYEQFIKLRGGGTHAVTGLYCAAAGNPQFRRRCYRLARGDGEGVSPEHLVHYRDCSCDVNSKKTTTNSFSQYSKLKGGEDSILTGSQMTGQRVSLADSSNLTLGGSGHSVANRHRTTAVEFDSPEDSALLHEMLEVLDREDFAEYVDVSLAEGQVKSEIESRGGSPQQTGFMSESPEQILQLIDMSPSSGCGQGGTKVLICFAGEVHSASTPIKVIFTPDFIVPSSTTSSATWVERAAGECWSYADLLSPSVVRCYTPPSPISEGCRCKVSLVSGEGKPLACSSFHYEYTSVISIFPPLKPPSPSLSSGSRKRQSPNEEENLSLQPPSTAQLGVQGVLSGSVTADTINSYHSGMHKIRIVEKFLGQGGISRDDVESSMRQAMACKSKETDADKNDDWLDDAQLLGMSSTDLEGLMDQFLLRVVQQLVNLASVDEDLLAGEELDGLDSSGYSLLHYCCLFNLTSLVSRLIDRGANINLKTRCNTTALHLACVSGHEAVVLKLLEAGAVVSLVDSNMLCPSDIAEQRGFLHIKYLLNQAAERQLVASQCALISSNANTELLHDSRYNGPMPTPDKLNKTNPEGLQNYEDHSIPSLSTSPNSGDGALSLTNMALLHGALSSLSLTDKCALSLTLQSQSTMSPGIEGARQGHADDFEVQSVLSENDVESLDLAMSMMGPQELSAVEDEVKVIQTNVRTWLLRKNYTNLRDAAKTLQVAWRGHRSATLRDKHVSAHLKCKTVLHTAESDSNIECTERTESSRNCVGMNNKASEGLQERPERLQGSHSKSIDACAATLQAATRGMLARRSFQRAKKQTMASLVIFQWWVQSKSKTNINAAASQTCEMAVDEMVNVDDEMDIFE